MTIPISYPPRILWFGAKHVGPVRPLTQKDRDFSSEYAPLSCSAIIFILLDSFNSDIWFDLILGCFDFLGPYWAIFVFNGGHKNCFGVHWCSLTTFIFYDSLNSDIWIWLNFGVIFVLWGPNGLDWGLE